jgi:hypothetical protein
MIRAFEQLRGTPFNENRKSHKGYWLRRGNEIAISLYIHTFILPYQTRLLPSMQLLSLQSHSRSSPHIEAFWEYFHLLYSLLKNAGVSVKWRPEKEVKCSPPERAKASGERKND